MDEVRKCEFLCATGNSVERKTSGKLLDAGTPEGQVYSPVQKDSFFIRPGGPVFSYFRTAWQTFLSVLTASV